MSANSRLKGLQNVRKGRTSRLLGGAGDDFIEAKGGEQDDLECGSGNATASVDLGDRVACSCEILYPG
jgi:hypothetical protein